MKVTTSASDDQSVSLSICLSGSNLELFSDQLNQSTNQPSLHPSKEISFSGPPFDCLLLFIIYVLCTITILIQKKKKKTMNMMNDE